jgi:hypothetical protein
MVLEVRPSRRAAAIIIVLLGIGTGGIDLCVRHVALTCGWPNSGNTGASLPARSPGAQRTGITSLVCSPHTRFFDDVRQVPSLAALG